MQTNKITLTCAHCQAEFERYPSQAYDSDKQYCSRACSVAGRPKTVFTPEVIEFMIANLRFLGQKAMAAKIGSTVNSVAHMVKELRAQGIDIPCLKATGGGRPAGSGKAKKVKSDRQVRPSKVKAVVIAPVVLPDHVITTLPILPKVTPVRYVPKPTTDGDYYTGGICVITGFPIRQKERDPGLIDNYIKRKYQMAKQERV